MAEQILLPISARAPRVMVFDLETLRSAGEVGGWSQIGAMGMACGVVHDSLDDGYHVFGEPEASALADFLAAADLVVGFNHVKFDYAVLAPYTKRDLHKLPSFDILLDVERRLGFRLKLQTLAGATLNEGKSADGMQSLRWVKEGRMDRVREYCRKDVEVTRRLFEYGLREGRLLYFDRGGEPVVLPVDWSVEALVNEARRSGKMGA
jgi:DEAD/DEAH box helicase domain-containing protein